MSLEFKILLIRLFVGIGFIVILRLFIKKFK